MERLKIHFFFKLNHHIEYQLIPGVLYDCGIIPGTLCLNNKYKKKYIFIYKWGGGTTVPFRNYYAFNVSNRSFGKASDV